MLDGHDALVSEQLLGVVVDELSVDEHVDVVLADLLNLEEETEQSQQQPLSCARQILLSTGADLRRQPESLET